MGKETNRNKWLHIRLTEAEEQKLKKQFEATTCNKFSDFARAMIFQKAIVKTYRNSSMDDFMAVMIQLKSELNSIGNNFNQLVKKINTYNDDTTVSRLLVRSEMDRRQLLRHIEKILSFIEENAKKW